MIGENSFTKNKGSSGNNANRKLYVKNCDALKELKIGRYSFSDYSVIEIENVNSLELGTNKQTNKQLNTPRTMAVGSRPYPWASTSIPAPSAA